MRSTDMLFVVCVIFVGVVGGVSLVPDWAKPLPDLDEGGVTWVPVDKVWVYQPVTEVCGGNCAGIRFYVTYKSSEGMYEIRKVNATTWYGTGGKMYGQGAV